MRYNEEEVSIIIHQVSIIMHHGMDYIILLSLVSLCVRSYIERAKGTVVYSDCSICPSVTTVPEKMHACSGTYHREGIVLHDIPRNIIF